MPRKIRDILTDSEKMRERARKCRQLAEGAGHPKFAITLNALSREYEGNAELIEEKANRA
jgi:hypothetical protein